MTQVRREALPALPAVWPHNKDSQGFLRVLAHQADRQIRRPNWLVFGGLFAALGMPEDALTRFAERVPAMKRRPYSLLHADLHRDNLIVSYGGAPPLICVDWELATYGDPLHELATHLVRMRYPDHQWDEVVEAWANAMETTRPAAVSGLDKDLQHYVEFERAQSVYPDVMRAAKSLENSRDQKTLDEATDAVRRALGAAAKPLRLRNVPSLEEIERILFRWRASRDDGRNRGQRQDSYHVHWRSDRRLPEHRDFPREAVDRALIAEGAAPANRVFKGTAHLNTVVWVADIDFPVVVRRKVAQPCRRERSFLSEHAVLRAIEQSRVQGGGAARSRPGQELSQGTLRDPHVRREPRHRRAAEPSGARPAPARGGRAGRPALRLTDVDYIQVDPAAGEGGFYRWLREQLVSLVRELPKESQQLARLLGLPGRGPAGGDPVRHQVSHRAPALLHGDLNPWNLVRRDDHLALTIIDWEMAIVGDPLYDLVRHMHLTPTRPEIRDRMFRRWELGLPDEYTVDWRKDWRAYRWIEIVRSAYIDLDRLMTGDALDAPNVRRAVDSYAMTLAAATASLGLPTRSTANPHLARALA